MKPFRYCPACGSRLQEHDHEGGAHCNACGRAWYRNPAPTVGAAIVRDGRALVTVRARPPHRGEIDIPGGFLQPGEDPVEGLRREVREELGIEVDTSIERCVQAVPHRYGPEGDWVLALGFVADPVGEVDLQPADDVAAARWVTAGELEELDFAWEHDRRLVRKALGHG